MEIRRRDGDMAEIRRRDVESKIWRRCGESGESID